MNVLVITTSYPFPPRNGVTIPVSNYIYLLLELGVTVDLVIIGENNQISGELVNNIYSLSTKRSKVSATIKELFGISPYCSNYKVYPNNWMSTYLCNSYDMILCSPFSVLKVGVQVKNFIQSKYGKFPTLVAAISDCFTAELYNSGINKEGGGFSNYRLGSLISRARSVLMKKMEGEALLEADKIFVQSHRDKAWLHKIDQRLSSRTHIVTNGVDENLFELSLALGRKAKNFCFVADLSVEYYRIKFIWLYNNVWCKISSKDKKLFVHSRNIKNSDRDLHEILSDKTIVFNDTFVPNISDIYNNIDVAFAPIFKSYGFINKVGEAMASGIVVIGDKTAFNAIPDFKSNVHGIIANDSGAMLDAVERLTKDIELLDSIKKNARLISISHLRWKTKLVFFTKLLNMHDEK